MAWSGDLATVSCVGNQALSCTREAPAVDAPAPEPRLRPQPPPPTLQTRPPAPPHAAQLQHLRGKAEACIILHAVHGLRVFNMG